MIKYFIKLILICTLAGCATTQKYQLPSDIEQSDLARIYIYRTDNYYHSLNPEKPYIYLADKVIAKLGTGQDTFIKIPAGKHRISIRQPILFMPTYESDYLEASFEKNKDYYIRYNKSWVNDNPLLKHLAPAGDKRFGLTTKENYDAKK